MTEVYRPLFISDAETKAVAFSPELLVEVPGIFEAHRRANDEVENDLAGRLEKIHNAQFAFDTAHGGIVRASVEFPEDGKLDEALITFAPFADRHPATDAKSMDYYLKGERHGLIAKEIGARPHTWSQATKSAVTHDLLHQLGHGMPVITIYSPIPTYSYDPSERRQQREGNFTAVAKLAAEAVSQAQVRIHGWHSQTEIDTVHLDGASLGATNAIGAAHGLIGEMHVKTVTARELILGIDSVSELAKRFVTQSMGEPSVRTPEAGERQVSEAALRLEVDKYGSEPIGMNLRSALAMRRRTYMKGLTNSEPTARSLEMLTDAAGVSALVATAPNSAMSEFTPDMLPHQVQWTEIGVENGQTLGHIMNEHVALSASIIAYHIAKSRS